MTEAELLAKVPDITDSLTDEQLAALPLDQQELQLLFSGCKATKAVFYIEGETDEQRAARGHQVWALWSAHKNGITLKELKRREAAGLADDQAEPPRPPKKKRTVKIGLPSFDD
jgi:hypothetical protein